MDGHIVNLSKKIVRYKEHVRLCNTCDEKKLIRNGLHQKAPTAFGDRELQDICQKFMTLHQYYVRKKEQNI